MEEIIKTRFSEEDQVRKRVEELKKANPIVDLDSANRFLQELLLAIPEDFKTAHLADSMKSFIEQYKIELLYLASTGFISEKEAKAVVLKKLTEKSNRYLPEVFESPTKAMAYFNAYYAKISIGGRVSVLCIDEEHRYTLTLFDKQQFLQKFSGKKMEVKTKEEDKEKTETVPAAPYWFDNTRNVYDDIVFNPDPAYKSSKAPTYIYNLWRGLRVEPKETGKAQSYIAFLKEVICNNNEKHFDYFIKVLAQGVQEPHNKRGVGITVSVQGESGIGKTFALESYAHLFHDENVVMTNTISDITCRFNAHLMNKIIVIGEEALFMGDRKEINQLKDIITSERLFVEIKFKEKISTNNYLRLFLSTNEDWAAPVEKNNRRYFVLRVNPCHKLDVAYFAGIKHDLEHGGYEDLLFYLLSVDIKGYNFQKNLPVTEATLANAALTMDSFDQFFYGVLNTGIIIPNSRACWFDGCDVEISVDSFNEQYNKSTNAHYPLNEVQVGIRLADIFKEYKLKYRKRNGSELGYNYKFPNLQACREYFCSYLGMKLPFEDQE